MGKRFDFSFPGGFPLSQDVMDAMQQHADEAIKGYGNMAHLTDPVILYGCVRTSSAITAGAIYYRGDIYFVTAVDLGAAPGAGYEYGFRVENNAVDLTYNDGSVHAAKLNPVAVFEGVPTSPGGGDTNTYFYLASMSRWGKLVGASYRTAWVTAAISVSTGTITGNIYYMKDAMTNMLHIRGLMSSTTAVDFAALPTSALYDMMTLPAGYRPANRTPFILHNYSATKALDYTGKEYIRNVTGLIGTDGVVSVGWLKPDAAYTGYSLEFSASVPLG